jgi:hypothetical protein
VIEIGMSFDLNADMVGDPPCADSARFLLRQFYPLELKIFVERVNRTVPPNDVVFFERSKKFGPLDEFSGDGVKNKTGVKRRDEGDVHGKAWRVLNLFDLHPVDLFALFFRYEVDLLYALAESCSLKERLKAR